MSKHSAAPWHYSPTHYGKAYDIGAADGDNVALIYGPAENGSDFFKANARLISAAPDLLEALEAVSVDTNCGDGRITMATAHLMRAAIAKAKGEM